MSAAHYVGRVGGIAAALGLGVVILGGTAVAAADTDGPDTSARGSAEATDHSSADHSSAAHSSAGPVRQASARAASVRGRVETRAAAPAALAAPAAAAQPAAESLPQRASSSVTLSTRAAAQSVRAAAVRVPSPAPSADEVALPPAGPSPQATVTTPYGVLGQWMINKYGTVADWVGLPYCGEGSTSANCQADTPGAKVMQEPINTIFVVKSNNEYFAKLKLDFALRVAGFGPSCCSSIGYSAIVGPDTDPQLPTGGPLGLGILPPLPFGLFQTGLLGLVGFGPAYRDAPFFLANSHLRVFGGESDGQGNYIFTASVSEENLDATGTGLLPTHGFESYDVARSTLTTKMVNWAWLTGASNQGLVAMDNAIAADDPRFTTGDHDGLAQVIALGAMVASSPARTRS